MADQRVEQLRRVPLFAGCSDAQLKFIASRVEEVDVEAGRELCREGSTGGEFFVLLSGAADVRQGGRPLRTMGPGEFFGEIALLDHGPRTATVVTTTPGRVLALSHAQFRDVLHQNSEIAMTLLHAVVARLRAQGTPPHD